MSLPVTPIAVKWVPLLLPQQGAIWVGPPISELTVQARNAWQGSEESRLGREFGAEQSGMSCRQSYPRIGRQSAILHLRLRDSSTKRHDRRVHDSTYRRALGNAEPDTRFR